MAQSGYKTFLAHCKRYELEGLVYHYGLPLDLAQLKKVPVAELRHSILEFVHEQAQQWLADLTLNDLQMLQLLLEDGAVDVGEIPQALMIEDLGLVDFSSDDEEDDDYFVMTLHSDIRERVEPLLDAVIARKQQAHEPVIEDALRGILNVAGRMLDNEVMEILCRLLPEHDSSITLDDIRSFMAHSMILRHAAGYITENNQTMLYSQLIPPENWEMEIRDTAPWPFDDINEILAHGTYPYFTPTRPCEKAFYQLLRDMGGYDHEEALCDLTYYYTEFQNAGKSVINIAKAIVEDLNLDSTADLEAALHVIMDFNNNIPKFILRGNSSSCIRDIHMAADGLHIPHISFSGYDSMAGAAERESASGPAPIGSFPLPIFPMKRVGRNDPCPCGSGKKYKNCCGMEN